MDGRALDTAIYGCFNDITNSFKTAMGGRFYATVAPLNATKPHSVYSIISAKSVDTFDAQVDDILLKISIFDASEAKHNCSDHVDKCIALFDRVILSVSGHGTIRLIRDNIVPPFRDEFKVWNAHIFFNFLLEY